MQPSEQTGPMGAPRRVPTAKDFPKTGPFSLAAPGPRFGARALDLSVVALPVLIVIAITAKSINGQLELGGVLTNEMTGQAWDILLAIT